MLLQLSRVVALLTATLSLWGCGKTEEAVPPTAAKDSRTAEKIGSSPKPESEIPAKPAAPWEDGTQAGQERDDNGLKLKLVWCPAGKFQMGSPATEKDRRQDEGPVAVTLTHGFWMGKYELTQGEWEQVQKSNPCQGLLKKHVKVGPRFPVSYVSWLDAVDFCQNLTQSERHAGRLPQDWEYALPTEAQWEYACRAGTTTRFSFGDDEKELPEYAWFGVKISSENDSQTDQTGKYAEAVGLKKPNRWGLFDMHGNELEWCRDMRVVKLPGGNDPLGAEENTYRAARGGNWQAKPKLCRSAGRFANIKQFTDAVAGFRVAAVPVTRQRDDRASQK